MQQEKNKRKLEWWLLPMAIPSVVYFVAAEALLEISMWFAVLLIPAIGLLVYLARRLFG